MTPQELKAALRSLKLSASGKKTELLARLSASVYGIPKGKVGRGVTGCGLSAK